VAGSERGSGDADLKKTQALSHPVRIAIMALFTRDEGRPLQAEPLTADLAAEFPGVKPDQVWYHVAVLRRAELIPAG
jgi:Fe2+ or Zn2+ uptake regulation protein